MGYTTDFNGEFTIEPALKQEHKAYLAAFAGTRRMKRDAVKAALRSDPIRIAAGLPIGIDGAYFVGADDESFRGQEQGKGDIIDHNEAPGQPTTDMFKSAGTSFNDWYPAYSQARDEAIASGAQPGLWCQWVPNADGTLLEWDGGEKFYEYVPWLVYLIENFLRPWGYTLDGEVFWTGEDPDDRGKIIVNKNEVSTKMGTVVYR